ncbi:MAG: ATP-binding protein [Bacteroidota bacterium]
MRALALVSFPADLLALDATSPLTAVSPFTSAQMTWLALGALALLAGATAWIAWLRTHLSRSMAELRLSEGYYRALLRSASDAVIVHDLNGQAVDLNAAAQTAFGLDPDDEIPSLFEVVAPGYHDRVEAHLVVLRAKGNGRCDLGLVAPEGEAPPLFEFESRVVEVSGERRVLSLARDVGARRAYEAELLAARRDAEEVARLKSAFLANMSHEIRTPLTAIIGYAELLGEEVAGEPRELAQIIEKGGMRLLDTLNSILDLARLDSGTEALYPRPLDLAQHVRQSVGLLRSLAETKNLSLHVQIAEDPLPVVIDAGALDRVVTNLVGNAIKFTEVGGVTVSLGLDGSEVILRVADTGIGIDEAFVPELFSEFRQESEGDARRHEGSGLGLAITHRLVTLMGGSIAVESRKGVGSTFSIWFPRLAPGVAEEDRRAFPPDAAMSAAVRPAILRP